MYYMTYDTWYMTWDRWGKVNLLLKGQLPSSHGLGMKILNRHGAVAGAVLQTLLTFID